MIDFDTNTGDPIGKASLLVFVIGFAVSHLVEFHDVIEVILDVVLVGVGFVSILNGCIKVVEKVQEWKRKNQRLKRSKQ